ncbi:MAG: cell filamentation protein Fic, partial [Flavobacteriales bacterium CG_4_10_14_0_8_um_filter_32_5]
MKQPTSEFIIFKTQDEKISVDVRLNEQDVWLTQDQLALLFGVERPGITQHIKNIFLEGELQENSVSKKFLRTAADGKKYSTKHYNLDMIISLGYRVNSKMA